MMVHQLYNVTTQTKDISTTLEFLQMIHLTKRGEVFNLDLSEMETRVMSNGTVVDHGKGVQPCVEEREYLLALVRMKTVKRSTVVSVKSLLFDGFSMVPTTVFIGGWGNPESTKGPRFWQFPQLDAVAVLYRIMTEGV